MTGEARPVAHPLADLPGLRVTRFVCSAGPRDRAYPEEHGGATMAVVLAGTFCYRCRGRTQAMVPGSVMLGEPGEAFMCSHEHGVGDVCLGVQLAPERLAAVTSACAAPGRLFAAPSVPPRPRVIGLARALARASEEARVVFGTGSWAPGPGPARSDPVGPSGQEADGARVEELALMLAGEVLGALAERARGPARSVEPSAADRGRAVAAAVFLAEHAAEPLSLGEVAATVGLSVFHFLRVFRRVFGVTPHQYLVQTRIQRAAARLLESEVPVTELAYEVGFMDLSNFVRTFHRQLGAPPGQFRRVFGRSKFLQVGGTGRR